MQELRSGRSVFGCVGDVVVVEPFDGRAVAAVGAQACGLWYREPLCTNFLSAIRKES